MGVIADTTHAFFWTQGGLYRVDRGGAHPLEPVAVDPRLAVPPRGLAADEDTVYWCTDRPGGVHAVRKDGTALRTLTRSVAPCALSADGGFVYAARIEPDALGPPGVVRVSKSGGRPELIAPAERISQLQACAGGVVWVEGPKRIRALRRGEASREIAAWYSVRGVAATAQAVYAAERTFEDDRIHCLSWSGEVRKTLAHGLSAVTLLGVGGSFVYWTSFGDPDLFRARVAEG